MKEDLKNVKDNIVGKVTETVGQTIGDEGLELKGKVQIMKSQIGEKLQDWKEEVAEKANDVIDWANPDKKDKDTHF